MVEDYFDPTATAANFSKRPGKKLRPEAVEEPSGPQAVAAGELRALIERVERVNEEIADLSEDRKLIFAEAKSAGFDTKAMRTIIRLRKKDQAQREEEEAMLDLYMSALGMV